jgi:glyoxylate reductase
MSHQVLVTRTIPEAGLDLLRQAGVALEVFPYDRPMTREELMQAVRGKDAVLCLLTDRIDGAVMDAAGPQCRIFANYAVGYNNIDLEAAHNRGVYVSNTPDVLTDATADLAWALLFATARRVVESDQYLRAGQWGGWGPMQFIGQDITGKTLGVVGAGRIGTNFALKSQGFRMPVLYHHPRENRELEEKIGARRVDLETLLRNSDYVALHVPLREETRHLISERQFAWMKPSAILINTARGPVVDEQALLQALKSGQIAGAGLDVYEHEPQLTPGLTQLSNVVLCPHIASATTYTRDRMATLAAENILQVLAGGKPINRVAF